MITLNKIQLLVSEDDVSNYNTIKSGLDRLRVLVEQSELWIYKKKDNFKDNTTNESSSVSMNTAYKADVAMSDDDYNLIKDKYLFKKSKVERSHSMESSDELSDEDRCIMNKLEFGPDLETDAILKYKELYRILSTLIKLCVVDEQLPSGQVIKKPKKKDQRLLKNMGVHNIVLDLTKISYEKKDDRRMRIIMRKAHEFLQSFCFQNHLNQVLLHDKIDLTNYPANEWEATTITSIFKDNNSLCNEINERLIQNCIHEIENQNSLDESKVPYLEFLQTICLVEETEIRKNQDMIIDELTNSEILSYWSDKMNTDELCGLMQSEFDQYREISIKNSSLLFHINLVKLLINCTVGKNTFTEIKCHAILPFEDIEKVTTNKYCLIEIKDIYMKFLYHCHIDTENETKEIFTQPYIWSLFENFVEDINFYLLNYNSQENSLKYSLRTLESYINENIIQIVIGFFSHSQFNYIPSPHTKSTVFKNLYSKLSQLYRCEWLQREKKIEILYAINVMQEKATFMNVSDITSVSTMERDGKLSKSHQVTKTFRQRKMSLSVGLFDPSNLNLNENRLKCLNSKLPPGIVSHNDLTPKLLLSHISSKFKSNSSDDLKHDSRLVNEVFQSTLNKLECEFDSKMQAEILVLIDVLTNPSCIFPLSVAFSDKSFDKSFISKLINHTKYLLKNQLKSDDMCINLIQIFRQMVYYNYYPIIDKTTEELRRNLLDKYLERKESINVKSDHEPSERRTSLDSLRYGLLNSAGSNESAKNQEKKSDECDEMSRYRVQCELNDLGASDLVIDLFTSEISNKLFKESVLLAIALLEGGNNQVQVSLTN